MSQPIAPQINYKGESQSANPKYRFLRIPMNNLTGSSFTVAGTTSQLIEFKLPNAVYNLAQSFLSYQISVPAQGAGVAGWIHEDCLEVATNAYFGTAGGLDLCNLNYVNRYTKVARKMKTKFTDFVSNDISSQLYPCNSAIAGNFVGVGASTVNFTEPRYLRASAGGTEGRNLVLVSTRSFPLKGIVDTIFSMDKDLYIPTDMYVRFTAGVGNQIAFGSTTNTDPTATPTAAAGNITVQNVFLFLAVEQNQLIVESVMNKVLTSGLKLNVSYTTAFRNSSTGTVANIQVPLSQQYGKRLKRMLHTVWNPTESANTSMDCSNVNGSKVTAYNTFLDQRQLQDFQLLTANSSATALNQDDWRENSKYCKDSAIQNRTVYQLNWFHCDQFYEPSAAQFSGIPEDNLDDGLTMDSPKLWAFQATTAADCVHYDFATFVRSIQIDRTGVLFV